MVNHNTHGAFFIVLANIGYAAFKQRIIQRWHRYLKVVLKILHRDLTTSCCHWRLASSCSISSNNKPVILTGNAASISRIQVGLVTLISVSLSPITSSPTKISPLAFRVGPMALAICQSDSDNGLASPRPPAARLPRVSPLAGILARQYGTGLPF